MSAAIWAIGLPFSLKDLESFVLEFLWNVVQQTQIVGVFHPIRYCQFLYGLRYGESEKVSCSPPTGKILGCDEFGVIAKVARSEQLPHQTLFMIPPIKDGLSGINHFSLHCRVRSEKSRDCAGTRRKGPKSGSVTAGEGRVHAGRCHPRPSSSGGPGCPTAPGTSAPLIH